MSAQPPNPRKRARTSSNNHLDIGLPPSNLAMDPVSPLDELIRSLKEAHLSRSFWDLKITCGADEYYVHKVLVCLQATFFNSDVRNKFLEWTPSLITLPDDDPLAVSMMIHYFYHLDYPIPPTAAQPTTGPSAAPSSVPNLGLHARVCTLGAKYGIAGLMTIAANKFESEARAHWNDGEFRVAVQEVFACKKEHTLILREVVFGVVTEHMDLLDQSSFQQVAKNCNLHTGVHMYIKKKGLLKK